MADETITGQPSRGQASAPPFKALKPGQGVYVRWGTAIGAGVIAVAGAGFAHEWLRVPFGDNLVLRTLIPVILVLIAGYLIFWLVGRHRGSVDFMIATEGEMKKVNWSSRREVWGATKVVIFTVLTLGFLLFVVDLFFMLIFSAIHVLDIPIWERWFGTGAEL